MAELWVGAGKPYASVSAAYSAAQSGDTIFVMAGTYTNECLAITRDVKIVGVGGVAHFKSTTASPNGKAIFVTKADVTFENVEFSGATVRDGNGAGIRYESGDLVIKNSYFHDNQNGILAASNPSGTIRIENTEFARNGKGDGYTHGLYVNTIAKLTILDSYFHDTNGGSHVKSRAAATEIRDTTLEDGASTSTYHIDLPNGGAATLVGNTLIQSAAAGNRYIVHYGGEVATPLPGSVLIEGNTFIDYSTGPSAGVLNNTSKTITLKENTFVGLDRDGDGGPYARIDNVAGVLGEFGVDVIGTAGLDKIDYRFSPGAVNVNLAVGTASDGYGTIDILAGVEHAGGSRFADVLAGDGKSNWLDGGDGADRLSGGAGDDRLEGGRGDDVIDGGAGVDTAVYDGRSSDYRVSLSGAEVVVQALNGRSEGVDRLVGVEKLRFADGVVNAPAAPVNAAPTAGNDQATTKSGTAVAIDVLGNDADANGDALTIASVGAPQHGSAVVQNGKVVYTPVAGYAGADSFSYQVSDGKGGLSQAAVSIIVEAAAQAPTAPALKTIVGTSASETLKGGDLDELIQAGGGNDIVYARAGHDRVEGGGGVDWLYGQDGDDALFGGTGYDKLEGGAGNDHLDGGTDNDELRGGAGNDVVGGGAGVDTAAFARSAADYRVTVDGGEIVVEALVGDEGVDRLTEVEKLKFADGVASAPSGLAPIQSAAPAPSNPAPASQIIIVGTSGGDTLKGGDLGELFQAGSGNDIVYARPGDDRLEGGHGVDWLYGQDGDDELFGGTGYDKLEGGAGNDLLDSGTDNDTLRGGDGADLFVFEQGCGKDVVSDFLAYGQADRIDLQAFDLGGFAALKALCAESASGVTIDLAGADSVTLLGKKLAELSAGDFLL